MAYGPYNEIGIAPGGMASIPTPGSVLTAGPIELGIDAVNRLHLVVSNLDNRLTPVLRTEDTARSPMGPDSGMPIRTLVAGINAAVERIQSITDRVDL